MKEEKKCINCIYYDICKENIGDCEYFDDGNTENIKEIEYYNAILDENVEIYNEILKEYE